VLRALSLLTNGCWHSVEQSLRYSDHWPGKIVGEKLPGEEHLHQSFRMLRQTCCSEPQVQILTHRLLVMQAAHRMDPAYAGHKSRGAHAEQGTSRDFPLLARCAESKARVCMLLLLEYCLLARQLLPPQTGTHRELKLASYRISVNRLQIASRHRCVSDKQLCVVKG
jgi:hypothetical protein